MDTIDRAVIDTALTYQQYRDLIDQLLKEHKTTGDNHSEAMLNYTTLNQVRMARLDKTTRIQPDILPVLEQVDRPLTWLVLTEAWCGDAAQVIPVLNRLAEQSDPIELKLILRDEHPRIMDAFLTNGGRSIPKLIILESETLRVLGTWGPRPAEAQSIVMEGKREMNATQDPDHKKKIYQDLAATLQKWYARDKTNNTQREVAERVRQSLTVKALI